MDKERRDAINNYITLVKNEGCFEYVEKLHEFIGPSLYYIANKYLGLKEDAEDLVQDFWSDIFVIAQGYKVIDNGYGYLCKVMTRRALNKLDKLKRENAGYEQLVANRKSEAVSEIEIVEKMDRKMLIEKCLSILNDKQRFVIEETYFLDKTVRQLAKEMNMSKSNVERIKLDAVEIMTKFIKKYEDVVE